MRLDELPDDIDEDANSGYQSSSDGMMVKESKKCPGSFSLSKDQSKGRERSKCKSSKDKSVEGKKTRRRGATKQPILMKVTSLLLSMRLRPTLF